MKKLVTLIFITFFASASKAQIAQIFANEFPDSSGIAVGVTGDYDLNSNAITNVFVRKFYTGGFIDNDLKNSSAKRLKNSNRIGGNVNTGIFASFKLDSFGNHKHTSLFVSLRDRLHFDASFSKDLFNVGFNGNAQFAGQTANLSNFNLNFIRYQQIQVGIFSSQLDSFARWGMAVSFLEGEQYLTVLAKKAELFTSPDGQYIDFNTEISAASSDTSKKGFGAFNGYGTSIDLFFEAPFQTRFGRSKICATVSDIGTIRFNKETLTLNQDSLFHYSGFSINNINDLKDSVLGDRKKDSIINSIIPLKKQSYSVTLPAVLNISYETQFSKHFHLMEGVRYIFNANYKLLMYVSGKFYLNPKLILSTTVGYGGYGNFNYGLGLSAKLGKHFYFNVLSNNIEGFITPKKTCGQGVYISLIKKFK